MSKNRKEFPNDYPFWGRLRFGKRRTTLVIDEDLAFDKKKKVPGFIHRESTHSYKKDYEKIDPNPDSSDNKLMYLKRPRKLPKNLIAANNKNLSMPNHLKDRYSKKKMSCNWNI